VNERPICGFLGIGRLSPAPSSGGRGSPGEYTGRTSLAKRLLLQPVAFLLFGSFWLLEAVASLSTEAGLMDAAAGRYTLPCQSHGSHRKWAPGSQYALAFFVGIFFVSLALAGFHIDS